MRSLCSRLCICIIPLKVSWNHRITGNQSKYIARSLNLTRAKALVPGSRFELAALIENNTTEPLTKTMLRVNIKLGVTWTPSGLDPYWFWTGVKFNNYCVRFNTGVLWCGGVCKVLQIVHFVSWCLFYVDLIHFENCKN